MTPIPRQSGRLQRIAHGVQNGMLVNAKNVICIAYAVQEDLSLSCSSIMLPSS